MHLLVTLQTKTSGNPIFHYFALAVPHKWGAPDTRIVYASHLMPVASLVQRGLYYGQIGSLLQVPSYICLLIKVVVGLLKRTSI